MTIKMAQGTPRFVGALWLLPLLLRRPWLRAGSALLAAGTTWFFRDPERTPDGEGLLAAADGIVQWIRADDEGRTTVSTYLDLLDVHVTRSPCDATVLEQTHRPGQHARASSATAETNERMVWRLSTEHGEMLLTQYAGLVARRIVPYRSAGAALKRGERIGLIRFGSRVDINVPAGFEVMVRVRQRTYGGQTVVARPEGGG